MLTGFGTSEAYTSPDMKTNPWLSNLRNHRPLVQHRRRYLIVTKMDVGKTASRGSFVVMEKSLFSDRINAASAQLQHACRKSLAALTETVKASAYTSQDMSNRILRAAARLFIPVSLLISLSLVVALCYFGHPMAGRAVAMLTPMILGRIVARRSPPTRHLMRAMPRMFVTVFALACLASAVLLCCLGHPEGAWPVGRLLLVCTLAIGRRRHV